MSDTEKLIAELRARANARWSGMVEPPTVTLCRNAAAALAAQAQEIENWRSLVAATATQGSLNAERARAEALEEVIANLEQIAELTGPMRVAVRRVQDIRDRMP